MFVEDGYRGVAVMQETRVAPYLSKFAVERSAQGEGIGGELWSLVAREFPRFFWRSRAGNAITPWYAKQCDGFTRFPEWHVFWRGLEIETIDPAVRFALDAPNDFASAEATACHCARHSVASGPPAPRTGSLGRGAGRAAMLRSAAGRSPALPYCMSGPVPAG